MPANLPDPLSNAPLAPGFWAWSLTHYVRPGVEPLLLRLQDEFDLSVNVLLWCMWCAEEYETAPEICVRKAVDETASWRKNVTEPMRVARRFLKIAAKESSVRALREQIRTAELAAEEIEQRILDKHAQTSLMPAARRAEDEIQRRARKNLTAYADVAQAPQRKGFSTALLERLIDCTFDAPSDAKKNTGSQL